VVAHPLETRMIAEAKITTDKVKVEDAGRDVARRSLADILCAPEVNTSGAARSAAPNRAGTTAKRIKDPG
jgi:hypothetical protein